MPGTILGCEDIEMNEWKVVLLMEAIFKLGETGK